jgi:acyl transferase domain-containing protein
MHKQEADDKIRERIELTPDSMTIKTACSSAGVCLHQALSAIRQGDISSAIVAGVNLIMAPGMSIGMSVQMTLSPEGSSKSFDASADGYARGEGVTALYVKRLDEAIRDGNPIRAIIRASATNADGKTAGLAMPNPEAHEAVIRQTYAAAGLDFSQTAMVEAHGTGTAVGDPLEVRAIANCFGKDGVYLGAVRRTHDYCKSALTVIRSSRTWDIAKVLPPTLV